jgi:hypothetical protein
VKRKLKLAALTLVPVGKQLCALFPHCTLVTLTGAHHNDVLDRTEVLKQIVDFALGSP